MNDLVAADTSPDPPAPRAATAPAVELQQVTVAFWSQGETVRALDRIDLTIQSGEFVAIVGPSGCGKTTIMNLCAGLIAPTKGTVLRDGKPVTQPGRDIGYMLARSALTPWRTARRNVELGLEIRGVSRKERRERAMKLLQVVQVEQFADAYPSQLSHGMQQRVAIARTLAIEPSLWLMDEPFGALDAQTRLRVQSQFLDIWQGLKRTVIFVTHDLGEAVLLADRVIVMSARPGQIRLDKTVPLERPRDLRELRFDHGFVELEREMLEELRRGTS